MVLDTLVPVFYCERFLLLCCELKLAVQVYGSSLITSLGISFQIAVLRKNVPYVRWQRRVLSPLGAWQFVWLVILIILLHSFQSGILLLRMLLQQGLEVIRGRFHGVIERGRIQWIGVL